MAKWGSVDYRQLERLRDKLEKFQEFDRDQFCRDMAKELAARLLAKVVRRTPVGVYKKGSGKVGGTLRRGWTAEDSMEIRKEGNNYVITIINPTPYASYVEYGHRTSNHRDWVPGRFMLTISEKEIQRIAPKLIEKKLYQKLKEAFGNAT